MIATLDIGTALRGEKTVLKNCYVTPPFKVIDITERSRPELHLMLMNASPGVLDGDAYKLRISVAAGCSLQLQTQSYQRLFHMKAGASQEVEIAVEDNGFFCFLPHPTVPHKASRFKTRTRIFASQQATLLWGDVLTCGRKGSGEQFDFSSYHNCTEIFMNGRLVIKENLLLQPGAFDVKGIGQLEGYTHQASLILLNQSVAVPALLERIHDLLSQEKRLCFGVTALPVNGVLVRLLGHGGEQLHGLLKKLAATFMHSLPNQSTPIQTALYAL